MTKEEAIEEIKEDIEEILKEEGKGAWSQLTPKQKRYFMIGAGVVVLVASVYFGVDMSSFGW